MVYREGDHYFFFQFTFQTGTSYPLPITLKNVVRNSFHYIIKHKKNIQVVQFTNKPTLDKYEITTSTEGCPMSPHLVSSSFLDA